MAIDKFGSPFSVSPIEDDSSYLSDPDAAIGSQTAGLSTTPNSDGGFSDAQGVDLAGAGIGAAATTAKTILNSIAAQNTINQMANQGVFNRENTAAENADTRSTNAQIADWRTGRAAEGLQNAAGATQINASLGGQGLADKATSSTVDRLAQLMSGNTKKRFGA